MTLMEAAAKWKLSPNWVRELIKSGRVAAKLRTDVPVPYYEIPNDTPPPPSMQRAPLRKGTGHKIQPASAKRRIDRQHKAKPKSKAKRTK